jgi:hypothetical protein
MVQSPEARNAAGVTLEERIHMIQSPKSVIRYRAYRREVYYHILNIANALLAIA